MPEIESAIVVWHTQCEWLSGGIRTYTGPIGRHWTHVLKCIVRAGPFSNPNNQFVAEHIATANERLKEKWRDDKRRQRRRDLIDGLRDEAMLQTAPDEAERRLHALLDYCRGEAAPHDLKRWSEATCRSVSHTWLGQVTLMALRQRHGSTHIARWLTTNGLANGRDLRALITRVCGDMNKLARVEELCIWGGQFDPYGSSYDPELNRIVAEFNKQVGPPSK